MWWFTPLKIHTLSLSFENWTVMCLNVSLFEFILLGVCWDSWIFIFMSIIMARFQSIFLHIFSLPLSLFSFQTPRCTCCYTWWWPSGCMGCSLLFFILLSSLLLSLDNFHGLIFKSTDSCANSNMPLKPSSEILISIIIPFSSRISIWFFRRLFIFINISVLFTHHFLDFVHIFL